jgi:hypothetical protein
VLIVASLMMLLASVSYLCMYVGALKALMQDEREWRSLVTAVDPSLNAVLEQGACPSAIRHMRAVTALRWKPAWAHHQAVAMFVATLVLSASAIIGGMVTYNSMAASHPSGRVLGALLVGVVGVLALMQVATLQVLGFGAPLEEVPPTGSRRVSGGGYGG